FCSDQHIPTNHASSTHHVLLGILYLHYYRARLATLRCACEPLLEPREVVVNIVLRKRRRLFSVHACAELLFYDGTTGGIMARRCPACCILRVSLSSTEAAFPVEARVYKGLRT